MIKRIKYVRLVIVLLLLLGLHFGVGFVLSPYITRNTAALLTKYTNARFIFTRASFWPLTLTLKVDGFKLFDPADTSKRTVYIKSCKAGLSLIGLLSKRVVFSQVSMRGVDVDVEGVYDDSFNRSSIELPALPKEIGLPGIGDVQKSKDWLARINDFLKSKYVKKIEDEAKIQTGVFKEVEALKRGRRVSFKRYKDNYLFEVNVLSLSGMYVKPYASQSLFIDGVSIQAKRLGFDKEHGVRLGKVFLAGQIRQVGSSANKIELSYTHAQQKDYFVLSLNEIDMNLLKQIHETSLPVIFSRGVLTLTSKTHIIEGELHSENNIILKDFAVSPRDEKIRVSGFLPLGILCDALNKINPLNLNFNIEGTVEKPKFVGFEESLVSIAAPALKGIGEGFQKQGLNFLNNLLKKSE